VFVRSVRANKFNPWPAQFLVKNFDEILKKESFIT
jgi:hypothetical protein